MIFSSQAPTRDAPSGGCRAELFMRSNFSFKLDESQSVIVDQQYTAKQIFWN